MHGERDYYIQQITSCCRFGSLPNFLNRESYRTAGNSGTSIFISFSSDYQILARKREVNSSNKSSVNTRSNLV